MSLMEIKLKIKEMPISSILGNYLHLRKRQAGTFLALCPFHQDKRPSLHVSDSKGLFKCFVCDIGGDAITFVEKLGRLSFIEATTEIAQKMGISIEDYIEEKAKDPKFGQAEKLLQVTAQTYQIEGLKSHLFQQFLKDRKIPVEVAQKFGLGYAPRTSKITSKLSITEPKERREELTQLALEVGLIREGKEEKQAENRPRYYDTFRDRIMFPIHNHFGKVVAFGSRSLGSAPSHAKYINSQDSFIFNKRHILYGLTFARQKIKEQDQVIIVEGYMDLITLHKFGLTNSVAVMGVGISEKSLQLLKNLTPNIVLALDSDEAGLKAMARINDECLKLGITPKCITFSPYKDPDEFLNQMGVAPFYERLKEAPLLLNLLLEKVIPSPLPQSSEEKLALMQKIFTLLAPLQTSLLALEKIGEFAKRLELYTQQEELIKNYRQFLDKEKTPPQAVTNEKKKSLNRTHILPKKEESNEAQQSKEKELSRLEKSLLKEILLHPDCLQHAGLTEILDNVVQPEVHSLIRVVKNLYYEVNEEEYPQTIINYLAKENVAATLRQAVGSILFQYRPEVMEDAALIRLVEDLKKRMAREKLNAKRLWLIEQHTKCSNLQEKQQIMTQLGDMIKQQSQMI